MKAQNSIYSAIPQATLDSLERYVKERIPTGGFLRAVLENNLSESFGRADYLNRAALFEICSYIYNEIPSSAWGTPGKVREWLGENDD